MITHRFTVIGCGLYKGMEFVFAGSPRGYFLFSPAIFVKRLAPALRFTLGTDNYQLYLGGYGKNIRDLEEFITNYQIGLPNNTFKP